MRRQWTNSIFPFVVLRCFFIPISAHPTTPPAPIAPTPDQTSKSIQCCEGLFVTAGLDNDIMQITITVFL